MPTLPKISPEIIRAYQEEINKTSSASTSKRKEVSLNRFFDWAKENGHLDENPLETEKVNEEVNQSLQKTKSKNLANVIRFGILGGLVIIIFLLTNKLSFPIPFVFTPAKEGVPESGIQTRENNKNQVSAVPDNSAGNTVNGSWNLYAKLKLSDKNGSPMIGSQTLSFKLYKSEEDNSPVWSSDPTAVNADPSGSALISLDGVPSELFFSNERLFLGFVSENSDSEERVPVSTASIPSNVGGYYLGSVEQGATNETIPVISSDGSLLLASESPAVRASTGNFLIEGQAVTIKTADGGDGNIEINPDGKGITHFLFEGTGQNYLNAQAPNLTSGSLYYGIVANNSVGTGYDLLRLQSGSKPVTRLSVDGVGNTYMGGYLNVSKDIKTNNVTRLTSGGALTNITDYSQNSGNFTINQNPGDFASIIKKGTALSDVLSLTLDERGKPATSNTGYSTLVLRRYDGATEAAALYVDEGNAIFDGQVQLGRFSSNPTAIGDGSLIFNTTDDTVYFWDGSTWVAVGTGGSSSFGSITSGTNTTATMVVGSGATLSFSGTGTITASELTCVGCVANSELANSSITFAGDSGSNAISLGGTLNIVGGEGIDTSLSGTTVTVAGEDATTLNKGIASFNSSFFTVVSGAVSIASDSLDFAQFQDSLLLDAATNINTGGLTLSTSGTGALNFASTGQVTFAGNVAINSGNLTSTTDLTINPAGGDLILSDTVTFNVGGSGSDVAYNVIGDSTAGASASVDSDDDLYIEGNLEVDGTILGTFSGTIDPGFTVGSVVFQGASGLSQDNANFFWDDTTNSLGLGDNTPLATLTIGAGDLFQVDGATGNITTAGDIAVNGGDITTTAGTLNITAANTALSGDLAINGGNITTGVTFDSTVTVTGTTTTNGDLIANGLVTLGDNGDTVVINSSDWDITATGDISGAGSIAADGDITLTQTTPSIFFVDSTAASDDYSVNIDGSNFTIVNDTDTRTDLSIDGSGTATFGGNVITTGTLAVNGDQITSDADLTIDAAGGNIIFADTDTLNVGGKTQQTYNFFADNADAPEEVSISSDDDLYIGGDLEVDGTIFGDGSGLTNVNATTLDSIDSTQFLRSDTSDNFTSGTLTFDAGTTLDVNGDLVVSDTNIVFDGASTTFTTTGDLTVDAGGGQVVFADTDTLNVGGKTGLTYNAFANAADSPEEGVISSDNDLYIGGDLEVDGVIYGSVVGSAGSVAWDDITAPTADLTLLMTNFNTDFNWDPGADSAESNFILTTQGEDTVGGGDEDQTLLALSQTSNGTDVDEAADALLTLANNDANDPVNSAIRFDAGAAGEDFTYGINFDNANIGTAEIVLENAEQIHNQTDGTIVLEDGSGTDYATFTSALTTIAGDLAITGGNITTAFTADSTVTVTGTLTANGTFDSNGDVTIADTNIVFDGASTTFTTTGDLTLSPGGGDVILSDATTINIGGFGSDVAYNVISDSGGTPNGGAINSDDDLYIEGALEVDGGIYGDGANITNVDAVTLDGLDSTQFLRSDTSDNYTSGTLTFDAGTTLDINGDLVVSDTNIAFDGASTTFTTTGALNISTGGTITIGDGGDAITINSSDWDISTTGDLTGIGSIAADGDITLTQATPSIFFVDSTGASDDYSTNVDGNAFTIVNDTDGRTELTFVGDGGIDFGDNTATKTIDIGGVTADASDTINISTNSTSADTITIGNANAATTLTLTGGDDWNLAATGVLTLSASAGQTTAIVITDTDYTNALSIADNNIIGTTAAIDFTNFDVATTGNITVAAGTGIDTNAGGALNIGTTNATSAIIGSASLASLTVTTNGTGDGEVVLPNDSIGPVEINDNGATPTDEFCLTYESSSGGIFEWTACTSSTPSWSSLSDPIADLTLTMADFNTTFNWDPGADTTETNFVLTTQGEDTTGGGDEDQVLLALSQTSNGADVDEAADSLLTLANNDANDPVNSAIRFDAGAAGTDFTYGINFDDANIGTAELILENGETIDNQTDGTVLITSPTTQTSGNLTVAGTGGLTLSGVGGDITFANGEKIDNDADGTIAITAPLTSLSGDLAINGGNITTAFTADSTVTVTGTLTANGTFAANGIVTLGDGGDTVAINSSDWDIDATGNISGAGTLGLDGDITNTQADPSIFLVDSTGASDDYSINVNGSSFTIVNDSDARTDVSIDGAGIVTLGSDLVVTGDVTVSGGNINTGNIALTIGDATTDSITLLTDGTGNAEVVLPNDSIGPNEVQTTGQTDEFCLTYESGTSGWEWQSCSGSSNPEWNEITDPTDDLTLTMANFNTTFNWDPTADAAETNFTLTTQGEDTVGGGDEDQVLLALSQTSNGADVDEAADALLTLTNNDANDPINSAIRFDAGAAGTDFTYGINFDEANIGTAELILENGETIDNQTDGAITLSGDLVLTDTNTVNAGGLSSVAYNSFANAGEAPEEASISSDNDLYIGGDLEVDGVIYGTISGSAGSVAWDDLTSPGGDLTLTMATFNTAFNWDPGADSAETNFVLTTQGEDTTAGGDEDQVLLALSQTSNGTDVDQAADALLTLANNDANDPIVNAIRFDAGAAGTDFTFGINFDNANIGTAEIVLENAEQIHNQSDGTIVLEDGSGTDYATFTSSSVTITGLIDANGAGTHDIAGTLNLSGNILTSTADLTINPGGGNVIFGDTDTLNVGGKTQQVYNFFADNADAPEEAAIDSDDDLYIGGSLEVDGIIYGDGSGLTNVNADTLDSLNSTQFLRSDTTDNYTSGTLTFDAGTTIDVDGDLVISDTDITFDGASTTFTITGDLTLGVGGGDVILSDGTTLNVGGFGSDVAYNVISDSGGTPNSGAVNSDDDLYIEGALEVDGGLYANSLDLDFTQGSVVFIDSNGALAQDNANFFWNDTDNRLGIGTTSPDRNLHSETNTALTDGVTYDLRLTSMTSGTAANGIGAGIEFETEDAAGNAQLAAAIDGILTNVTSGVEKGALVIKTADQGSSTLAEAARFTNQGDLVTNGHVDISSTSNSTDIYTYDTTRDRDGGLWRNDDRAKSSSWYNEAKDDTSANCDISTMDRCGRNEFPEKVFIVATTSNVYIYDAKDNYPWMRFDQGSDVALGTDTNNNPSSVHAQNGKLYIGTNGSSATGAYIIDFKIDKITKIDVADARDYADQIGGRNTDPGTPYPDQDRNSLALVDSKVNDVMAQTINFTNGSITGGNGDSYLVAATDAGVSLVKETDQTTVDFTDNASDNYNQVWLTTSGDIFTTNETTGTLEKWALATNQASDQTTPTTTWDEGTTPALTSAALTIQIAPSDLFVTEGTSTVDGRSPTVYVGTDLGLTAVNTKIGDETNGSVKYYTNTHISEELVGDIRGAWGLNDTDTDIDAAETTADLSRKGETLTASNANSTGFTSTTGVRNEGVTFDGTDDYFTCTDAACGGTTNLDTNGTLLSVGAWINSSSFAGSIAPTIISKENAGGGTGYRLRIIAGTGVPVFRVNEGSGGGTVSSSIAITTGNWYHIVGTYDGTSLKIYVNGQLAGTTAFTTAIADDTSDFSIGARASSTTDTFFTGSIDEPFVTAEGLTAGQVKRMYEVGLRALQNHTASRISGVTGVDTYQQLLGNGTNGVSSTSRVFGVGVDSANEFVYAGLNDGSGNTGGVSVIGIDSDTAVDLYTNSVNTTKVSDAGTTYDASDITSLSVSGTPCSIGYNSGGTNCQSQVSLGIAGEASGGTTTSWLETTDYSLYAALAQLTSPDIIKNNITVNNVFQVFNSYNNQTDSTTGETIQTASLSVDSNGYVVYNYLGSDTGTAWDINDSILTSGTLFDIDSTAMTSGNVLDIAGNALTTGSLVELSSTTIALSSGSLVDVTLSGSNAANAGSLLQLTNSGTANTGTTAFIKHYATGTNNLAFRIDDVSSDSTPLVVDGDGNLGVGTAGPDSKIDALDGSNPQLRLTQADGTVFTTFQTDSSGFLLIDPSGSRSALDGSLQVGSTSSPQAFSRYGTAATGHGGNLTASNDLLISGDLELDGIFFLDGENISDSNGTATITFAVDPTAHNNFNVLTNGGWLVENPTGGHPGIAALMVNQARNGAIFAASASGTNRFLIANNGTVTITTTNAAATASLVVSDAGGTGTGKIDVGTVDPPYTINGKKYATFLSGIVGVKEEVAGQIDTNQYIAGLGYRNVIDFNNLPEGSDLWLFGKTTNIKENIGELVALLTPSTPTSVWYEVDEENKRLVVNSARPTQISYRLTAPRFDHETWSNRRDEDSEVTGFVLNDIDQINTSPIVSTIQNMSDYTLQEVQDGFYTLRDSSNNLVDGLESFGNFVAANIKAGSIQGQKIIANSINATQILADNILVATGITSPEVKTALISPLADGEDIQIKLTENGENSSELVITDEENNEVASIDAEGNANFEGEVEAESITSNDVFAGKIYADEIVARNGSFGTTNTSSLNGIDREEIEALLTQVEESQSLLAEASTWNLLTATDSASLDEIVAEDLYITDQAAINSLSVTNSLALGTDLIINSVDNSFNSLTSPLQIQSLALAPVEIMAGKIKIETNGDVTIQGNVAIAGKLDVEEGIDTQKLSTESLIIATPEESSPSGQIIPGNIEANTSVGKGIIPAGSDQITITNPKVTDYSLIYVTPTSSTENQVLYVKSKTVGSFNVGFTNPIGSDAEFNWWIVETGQ